MRVLIMEKDYDSKRQFDVPTLIKEGNINRQIEQLEARGFSVVQVQFLNFPELYKERVYISYR